MNTILSTKSKLLERISWLGLAFILLVSATPSMLFEQKKPYHADK
jgi:hypothetical protein